MHCVASKLLLVLGHAYSALASLVFYVNANAYDVQMKTNS